MYNPTFINYSLQIWIAFVYKAYQLLQSLKTKAAELLSSTKKLVLTDYWIYYLVTLQFLLCSVSAHLSLESREDWTVRNTWKERKNGDGWKSILGWRMCNQMKAEKWL